MEDRDQKKTTTIKRYSNRKLYDMSRSRYITLAELGELIRRGENIVVIDNDTKADLTEMTLTQVLMAQQKQKQMGIRNLVQSQAEILLQRISVPMQQIRDEALRQVEKQVVRFWKRSDGHSAQESPNPTPQDSNDASIQSKATTRDSKPNDDEHAELSPSLNLKLESLRASSDEKLLSLLIVQRLEQLESEIADLKRRLELLERKDDDSY
jgi:polyhydroxyalkanoate synthesis repressor PhaR